MRKAKSGRQNISELTAEKILFKSKNCDFLIDGFIGAIGPQLYELRININMEQCGFRLRSRSLSLRIFLQNPVPFRCDR